MEWYNFSVIENNEIQSLKIEVQKASTDKWKLIAVSLNSIITSGGVISIIEYVRTVLH